MMKYLVNTMQYKRLFSLIAWLIIGITAVLPLSAQNEAQQKPYTYLAIGNSITHHPQCEYWWSEAGMAATSPGNDYFHLVADYLAEKHELTYTMAINFVEWETEAGDKANTYPIIDFYLNEDVDLITLQLSENAAMNSDFRKNYTDLVRYIRTQCPKAKVILVDDFWSKDKSAAKKKVATALGLPFADLSKIRGKEEYRAAVNDMVFGMDGSIHFIDREDVAQHPNDKGMKAIADAIIKQIKKLK